MPLCAHHVHALYLLVLFDRSRFHSIPFLHSLSQFVNRPNDIQCIIGGSFLKGKEGTYDLWLFVILAVE